jgi:diguanylate cyclase (GGDEF)-like protein/PAS domain S-box-containing protein
MDSDEASGYFGSLRQLSQAVHEGRSLESLLGGLMSRAQELPGVDTVRILLADAEKHVLVAQPGTFPASAEDSPVPVGVGFAGRIAQTRRPLLVSDLSDFPVHSQALREAGVRSAIGAPLLAGEHLVGVMHIGSHSPDTFTTEMIPELEQVAERVALTIEAIQAETALAASEYRFRTFFEGAPIGMCITDLNPERLGHILLANTALSQLTGYAIDELVTMNVLDLLAPDHRSDGDSSIESLAGGRLAGYTAERRLIRADGSTVWVVGNVSAVNGGEQPGYAVSYLQDITARKSAEADLSRRAFTDSLTGLANRHLVMDHLALALRQEVRSRRAVGVLYLDVDHFKRINDAHGHEAGDRVLREVAARLTMGMRAADTPGRVGGDEFIVICPELSSVNELVAIADRLLEAVSMPVSLPNGPTIDVTVSIGLATGDRGSAPEELIRRADVAMYEAKRQGRHRRYRYSPGLDHSARSRRTVESLLGDALERGWFLLHYQPIVELLTGDVVGVEALLRIQHPEQGLLGPEVFVAQLEESPLAEEIESWVLRQACHDWCGPAEGSGMGLAVNVSGQLAASGHLTETVLAAAEGFPVHRLSIEMTERVMVHAGPTVSADLERLAGHGIGVAIDDFGTGYASLTYLQNFPVNIVKIDRSFVAGLGRIARDEAIVRAVVTLGGSLDTTVIAEGVESQAQANYLRAVGCQLAQGYLFGRPVPQELARPRSSPRR